MLIPTWRFLAKHSGPENKKNIIISKVGVLEKTFEEKN
jgi:hypothetical protein